MATSASLGLSQQVVEKIPEIPVSVRNQQPCEDGAVWVQGEWVWDKDQLCYTWVNGHCEKGPKNKAYHPGRWLRAEGGWTWVPGRWESLRGQHRR